MVQILLELKDGSKCIKEWVIVEVQGDIESNSGSSVEGKLIGVLHFTTKGKPILIIGYHILYGRIIENDPSIAILQKNRNSDVQSTSKSIPKERSTSYTILALVKKRIIFRARPKPIISKEEISDSE